MAVFLAPLGFAPTGRFFSMNGLLVHDNSRSSETPWTSLVVEFHVGSEISLEDSFLASSQAGSAVES